MARIKIIEAKPGEELSSSDFNENMASLRNFEVDGSNIAQEGINQSKVETGTVFDRVTSLQENGTVGTITHTSAASVCNFTSSDVSDTSWPDRNRITNTALFSSGESIICRASSRVYMRDFGSRTFFSGVPPLVSVQLMYTLDSTPEIGGDWRYATGTKQWFSCAFSSKIPSDSGGDSDMTRWFRETYPDRTRLQPRLESDRFDLLTRNDDASGEDEYDIELSSDMFFHYDFSYTTAWVLNYSDVAASAPVSKITFALMGTAYDPAGPQGSSSAYSTDWENAGLGCRKVEYKGFQLRNLNMYMYKVKK